MSTIRPIILAMLLVLTACTSTGSMPIRESRSPVDNTVELHLDHAIVSRERRLDSGSEIQIGLLWRQAKPEEIIMTVYVNATNNFAGGQSLQFVIDGEDVTFDAMDKQTGTDGAESSMRYIADLYFLNKISHAKDVAVRVNLDKGYLKGYLPDQTKKIIAKFRERCVWQV